MKHAEDYQVVLSDEGVPVFVLPYTRVRPENPILLYDGGRHATLFRNDHDVLLIDYIPAKAAEAMNKCGRLIVLEHNKASDDVLRDYQVLIKKVKNNPLIDGLEK